jgi:prevent-host-death family protein
MNLVQDIKPISYIKAHASEVLSQINETHRPIFITQNGEAKAVIVDPESYQSMQDSLKILKLLSQSEKEYEDGEYETQTKFFSKLNSKYK